MADHTSVVMKSHAEIRAHIAKYATPPHDTVPEVPVSSHPQNEITANPFGKTSTYHPTSPVLKGATGNSRRPGFQADQ